MSGDFHADSQGTTAHSNTMLKQEKAMNFQTWRKRGKVRPDCLHHIFAKVINAFAFLFCHRDSEQAGWSKTATNSGTKGTNIPFNEDT